MSAQENKEFVRGVFAQMAAGNGRALTDAMADDFRWVIPGQSEWAGTWESKAAVLHQLLLPLMSQFEGEYRSEVDLILADGDHVMVKSRGSTKTRNGEPYDQTYCYIFRVDQGKLAEVTEFCDTSLVERVLEPPAR